MASSSFRPTTSYEDQKTQLRELLDVYLINLPSAAARLEAAQWQFKRCGISWYHRIDGIYGKKAIESEAVQELLAPGVLETVRSGYRETHFQHNAGSVGCYLAHLRGWYKFISESKKPYCLILEDDISLPIDTIPKLLSVIKDNVNSDWDALVVGNVLHWDAIKSSVKKVSTGYMSKPWYYEVQKPSWFIGANAYLLNRKNITYMYQHAFPIKMQFDWWLAERNMSNKMRVFTISPCITNISDLSWASSIDHSPVKDENSAYYFFPLKTTSERVLVNRLSGSPVVDTMNIQILTISLITIAVLLSILVCPATYLIARKWHESKKQTHFWEKRCEMDKIGRE
jgi:GR25 family glycosyltransferase involved in LPS biosynthesis